MPALPASAPKNIRRLPNRRKIIMAGEAGRILRRL
jgi:hypothetical protein